MTYCLCVCLHHLNLLHLDSLECISQRVFADFCCASASNLEEIVKRGEVDECKSGPSSNRGVPFPRIMEERGQQHRGADYRCPRTTGRGRNCASCPDHSPGALFGGYFCRLHFCCRQGFAQLGLVIVLCCYTVRLGIKKVIFWEPISIPRRVCDNIRPFTEAAIGSASLRHLWLHKLDPRTRAGLAGVKTPAIIDFCFGVDAHPFSATDLRSGEVSPVASTSRCTHHGQH